MTVLFILFFLLQAYAEDTRALICEIESSFLSSLEVRKIQIDLFFLHFSFYDTLTYVDYV